MSTDPVLDKRELRQRLRDFLKGLSGVENQSASGRAVELLRSQVAWRDAGVVLFYVPLADELDLSPLLAEGLAGGKTICLPRFVNQTVGYEAVAVTNVLDDCAPGRFGISEPKTHCPAFALNRLDLTLVPGVGFDPSGSRLGRGQGFYDRLLARISGIKCGVAFDQQIVKQIPTQEHDARMNFILTPSRWLEIPR